MMAEYFVARCRRGAGAGPAAGRRAGPRGRPGRPARPRPVGDHDRGAGHPGAPGVGRRQPAAHGGGRPGGRRRHPGHAAGRAPGGPAARGHPGRPRRPRPWTSPTADAGGPDPAPPQRAATSGSSRRRQAATGGDTAIAAAERRRGGRPGRRRRQDPLARGIWDVWVKVRAYGWERATRVGIYRAQGVSAAVRPALVGAPPAVVTPYWTEPGNLALDVDQSTRRTATALTARPRPVGGAGVRQRG